jgi:predicted nucleic acid-binding protein
LIVVSNSSPLIALSAIGHLELLHSLYDQIWIPEAVYQEVAGASKGLLLEVRPALNDLLTKAGFRISAALYQRALEEAGE